jgi:hypothetical protein
MPSAPSTVYLMCLATSVVCAGLLLRTYLRTGARLLLWVAASFAFLALNNAFLVADMVIWPGPQIYLMPYRQLTSFLALGVLLYGFIMELDARG